MAREITDYNGVWCWVDTAHVDILTGVTPSEEEMARAQVWFENLTDVSPDPELLPDDLKKRDRRRLEDAYAYQAAWMSGRIDFFHGVDAEAASQDGASVTYLDPDSTVLAPLASRLIRKLSWNSAGVIRFRSGRKVYRSIAEIEAAWRRDEDGVDAAFGPYCSVRPMP